LIVYSDTTAVNIPMILRHGDAESATRDTRNSEHRVWESRTTVNAFTARAWVAEIMETGKLPVIDEE
jgi:hypothetical protein